MWIIQSNHDTSSELSLNEQTYIHFHCIGVEAKISEADIPNLNKWNQHFFHG